MRIKYFIDNQWVEYADYDNRRSLPNIMDGLKITQRKAMYTALRGAKNAEPTRVSQFASKAAGDTAYHHGEGSMIEAVVGLAQDFPGKNNFPLLEKHGQFGSRLSPEPSAPRYITTKLHQNWDKFFKKEDQDIVIPLFEDELEIEPKYYIPIVPMVLINGGDGIGNGYSSYILNYGLADVVRGLKELIKHGEVKTPLIPNINGFTGKTEKIDRQVVFTGKLKIVHSTKLHITELPPGYDNDKYKTLLNKLIDSKFIKGYNNHSTEDAWDWTIECPRETSALGVEKLQERLGLVGKITETFVGWGVDDTKPMTFKSPEALLAYWYEERLKLYDKSLKYQIKVCKAGVAKLYLKIQFVKWCLKHDFRKLSKAEFIAKSMEGVKKLTADLANEFVSMPMYRITTDEVEKLELDMDRNLVILEDLQSQTPIMVMERNLKGL